MSELAGPRARLVELVVAELQDAARHGRVRVDQERQHVDLGVPEVVAFVGLSGQPTGADAVPFGARRCLQELEEVPADDLLLLRCCAALDLDVGDAGCTVSGCTPIRPDSPCRAAGPMGRE